MPNPSLLEQFCSDGQKDAVSTILQTAGWSPENPNINGYQLNTIFNEIYTYLNYLKNKGLSFWEDTKTYKATAVDIDIVRYANKIYFAKQDSNLDGLTPKTPDTNPTYWGVLYDLDKPLETTYALLGGLATQTFKVADAVNPDEALNKGQGDILYKGVAGYQGALDTIDLNTAFKAQTFYASSNALNLPTAYGGYIEISGNSYNRASQTFISQDGNIYFRKSDDGSTWSVWRQLAIQDDFVSLKATNGYQRLANGVIIQWGTIYANTSADTGETFTFPIAFPNACFVVTGSPEDNNSGTEGNDVWRNLTTTNFVLENWTGVATNFRYMAIGY